MDIALLKELKELAWPLVGLIGVFLAYLRLGEVARLYEMLKPENLAKTFIQLEDFKKRLIADVQNEVGGLTPDIEELSEAGREHFAEISDIWGRTKDKIEARAGNTFSDYTRYTYAKLVQALKEAKKISMPDADLLSQMEGAFMKMRRKPGSATAETVKVFRQWEKQLRL